MQSRDERPFEFALDSRPQHFSFFGGLESESDMAREAISLDGIAPFGSLIRSRAAALRFKPATQLEA
jgi:hypothetical protein